MTTTESARGLRATDIEANNLVREALDGLGIEGNAKRIGAIVDALLRSQVRTGDLRVGLQLLCDEWSVGYAPRPFDVLKAAKRGKGELKRRIREEVQAAEAAEYVAGAERDLPEVQAIFVAAREFRATLPDAVIHGNWFRRFWVEACYARWKLGYGSKDPFAEGDPGVRQEEAFCRQADALVALAPDLDFDWLWEYRQQRVDATAKAGVAWAQEVAS